MATNEKWYKKIWLWLVAIGAGIVAFVRLRTRISGQSGTGIKRVGDDIEQLDSAVTGATSAVSEVANTVSDVDDTARGIADTSGHISDTAQRIEELNNQATNSVGRIRKLINAERERIKQSENNE